MSYLYAGVENAVEEEEEEEEEVAVVTESKRKKADEGRKNSAVTLRPQGRNQCAKAIARYCTRHSS